MTKNNAGCSQISRTQQSEQLAAVGAEMVKQNNRATQYPLFVVWVDVERVVPEDMADGCHRKDFDICSDGLCEACSQKFENEGSGSDDWDEFCPDCDPDCFWWYKTEQEADLQAGVFFTAKACEEHIRLNGYHYNNPKSYAICAWRNDEMVAVMQHLITMAGQKIPSCYQ